MTNPKPALERADHLKMVGGQDFEAEHLAAKTGITPDQARDLIQRLGNDPELLEQAAATLKRAG
jgi:hypothetical protein